MTMKINYVPQAVYSIANGLSVTIMLSDDNETLRYKWGENKVSKPVKIQTGARRCGFFKIKGIRYHLCDFIKI